jgi:hypothetical protein
LAYLNCTRCRLSIEQDHGRPDLQDCPRCLAKLGEAIPLFRSPLPLSDLFGTVEAAADAYGVGGSR